MICIRCMNEAVEGHRLCEHCLEEAKRHRRAVNTAVKRRWREHHKEQVRADRHATYLRHRDEILAKLKKGQAAYNKEDASKHALCVRCGKNPRLYKRKICAECRNREASDRYQSYKDGLIPTKPCSMCGKNPRLHYKTMCAECRNAQRRQDYKEQKLKKKEKIMKTDTTDIKHAAYTAVCSKILDMAVDNYKEKEKKELCKVCGKAPRLSYSKMCHECYAAVQHEYYEARKKRRACKNTDELCSVCGEAPKLASNSMCRDCFNAYKRNLHKVRTDKGVTQTDTPAPLPPKKDKGLCIVCGKNPKLPNMGKCRDCYNAHRRMSYAQLKKDAEAAKAGQKSVQVQVMDPVQVEVNNTGCGYVSAILFVLWIITVIGLVFR